MMQMISGQTKLIALLGEPVSHSLSPVMHNAALTNMGLDWCYLALPCPQENIELVLKALHTVNCKGLNITIPHKKIVAKLCNELTSVAKRTGAVNTLLPNKEGGWTGTNTDIEGFIAPLQNAEWTNKQAIVLGCGGSASAVIAGLQNLNFEKITIVGRKQNALNNFIEEIIENPLNAKYSSTTLQGCLTDDLTLIKDIQQANLVVNTTPVGMAGNPQESESNNMPLGKEIWKHLSPETTLYDLIYTPKPTSWLTWGNKLGCKSIDGLEMLVQQGAASLKMWSGTKHIPIKIMRKAALTHLKH